MNERLKKITDPIKTFWGGLSMRVRIIIIAVILAAGLPNGEGERFRALHDKYETVLQEVLFYRNKCKELLSSKIYGIERRLDAMGAVDNTTYNSQAGEVQTSRFPQSFHLDA